MHSITMNDRHVSTRKKTSLKVSSHEITNVFERLEAEDRVAVVNGDTGRVELDLVFKLREA